MTEHDHPAYLQSVRAEHTEPIFIPRHMIGRAEWDRAGGEDYLRLGRIFPDLQPGLGAALAHPHVVFVGEPGMGETWLAHASMLPFAEAGHLPIFAGLSGYRAELDSFLTSAAGLAHTVTSVEGKPVRKAYIFDGLDEIPDAHVHEFLSELDGVLSREPDASAVLTCRQAKYEAHWHEVPPTFR